MSSAAPPPVDEEAAATMSSAPAVRPLFAMRISQKLLVALSELRTICPFVAGIASSLSRPRARRCEGSYSRSYGN
eukprot:9234364-Prorocentrum_lima.AAC.1